MFFRSGNWRCSKMIFITWFWALSISFFPICGFSDVYDSESVKVVADVDPYTHITLAGNYDFIVPGYMIKEAIWVNGMPDQLTRSLDLKIETNQHVLVICPDHTTLTLDGSEPGDDDIYVGVTLQFGGSSVTYDESTHNWTWLVDKPGYDYSTAGSKLDVVILHEWSVYDEPGVYRGTIVFTFATL